jgi:predicted nucleic acid-binding protein
LAIPFIWLDVSFGCIRHAQVRFREGLDPRDAFHAAVMDHYGLDEIVSEDIHFNKVKGIRRKTIKETIIVRRTTGREPP